MYKCVCLLLSTGRYDTPLADTFPDPAGRHFLGQAVVFGLGQRVCGRGGGVVRYEVSVIRHEVPPQLVKVLHGDWQEELDPAEDVQQRLQDGHKRYCLTRGNNAGDNNYSSQATVNRSEGAVTCLTVYEVISFSPLWPSVLLDSVWIRLLRWWTVASSVKVGSKQYYPNRLSQHPSHPGSTLTKNISESAWQPVWRSEL